MDITSLSLLIVVGCWCVAGFVGAWMYLRVVQIRRTPDLHQDDWRGEGNTR